MSPFTMVAVMHVHVTFIPRKGFTLQSKATYPAILSRFSRPISSRRNNSLRRKLLDPRKGRLISISPLPSPLRDDLCEEASAGDATVGTDEDAQRWDVHDDTLFNSGSTAIVDPVRNLKIASYLSPTMFGIGGLVLSVVAVLSVVRSLHTPRKEEVQFTLLEKEMMRRKIKSREERAASSKAGLVICKDDFSEALRPELNLNEVVDALRLAKPSDRLGLGEYTSPGVDEVAGIDVKVEKMRGMARKARENEHRRRSLVRGLSNSEEQTLPQTQGGTELDFEQFSQMNMAKSSEQPQLICAESELNMPVEEVDIAPYDEPKTDNGGSYVEMADALGCIQPLTRVYNGDTSKVEVVKVVSSNIDLTERGDTTLSLDFADDNQNKDKLGRRRKPKIIRTVREAKVYLSNKHDSNVAKTEAHTLPPMESEINSQTSSDYGAILTEGIANYQSSSNVGSSRETSSFMPNDYNGAGLSSGDSEYHSDANTNFASLSKEPQRPDIGRSHLGQQDTNDFSIQETALSSMTGNWVEKFLDEMRPIFEKMGDGFRNSYMSAREKASECSNFTSDLTQLQISAGNSELEWMKDEKLREIVFQVRDNELAGRDPFYSMQTEDRQAFFEGLEKKVEKENEKLSNLHEYLHSNIENLDYGTDGISIYDPIAKIVPRWKDPPIFTYNEFLSKTVDEKVTLVEGEEGKSSATAEKSSELEGIQSSYPEGQTKVSSSLLVSNWQNTCNKVSKKGKVVIEGSDGSVRAGKKLGKEYWQHTKKWSRGFLDSYNSETDPEIKSVMKDVGKDLDRWITEKEIQEAADIRDKFLARNKQYVEKKLKKLRKEVELFGPKAVVSKYSEYAEEKDRDYLWWLDLPFVLCIELYSVRDGEQNVGFYSLEMAADLELEPKPHHVIAFEDLGDCKNLCYIIQAHMEILQNGHAFVVPRPSKDAFREAKANGFGVTVIRKGEIKLNVDQTLEEVEEQITEVGSRIYHDKIMKEHSVDTSQLMAGVFGVNRKTKKRNMLKQTRKRVTKK